MTGKAKKVFIVGAGVVDKKKQFTAEISRQKGWRYFDVKYGDTTARTGANTIAKLVFLSGVDVNVGDENDMLNVVSTPGAKPEPMTDVQFKTHFLFTQWENAKRYQRNELGENVHPKYKE